MFIVVLILISASNLKFQLKEGVVQYNYTSQRGNCVGFNLIGKYVSLVTCRFRCDMEFKCKSFVFDTNTTNETNCMLKYRTCETIDKNVFTATTYVKQSHYLLKGRFYRYEI